MNDFEQPAVTKIRETGYAEQPKIYGTDLLGNEVYVGEEIYVLDMDEFIGTENLGEDGKKILNFFNVPKMVAKN